MNFSYRTAAIKSSDNFGRWSDKKTSEEKVVALAGNPNVGKSTVFNSLTGLRQHTGNWPGKTVSNACGQYCFRGRNYTIVDIPGTYSLLANSAEEEIARDFICFGNPDAVVVVADSTCLERNLYLLLQILEITDRVGLCVNLMDEAKKKKIDINLELLSLKLGIPVVGTSARSGKGLNRLLEAVASVTQEPPKNDPLKVSYGTTIEKAVSMIEPCLESCLGGRISGRWIALKLLEGDDGVLMALNKYLCLDISGNNNVWQSARRARNFLFEN
ncbi:MAG: ferrous iron transporter B, partial [Clostridiales bacterium]|nr:ferrous iron transporter B [Clostridiales bacterium]